MKFRAHHRGTLLLPLALVLLYSLVAGWMGPRYLDPLSDPQYPYLLNSLALASGSYPGHMDHPGTTVQLLGAGVLKATIPDEGMVRHVLKNPEPSADRIASMLVLASALFILFSGVIVAGSFPLGLEGAFFFQLWPFLFLPVWSYFPRLAPDFFLLGLSQLFFALVVSFYPSRTRSLALGTVLGLIMATKISALLFAGVPVLLLWRNWKRLMECYFVSLLTFVAVLLLGYGSKIKYFTAYFFHWIWGLAAHKGWYGDGAVGVDASGQLATNFQSAAMALPLFFLSVICLLVLFRGVYKFSTHKRPWVACTAVALGQIVLLMKSPEARYVIPALPAAGGALLFVFALHRKFLRPALLVAFLICVWAFWKNGETARTFRDAVLTVEKAIPPGAPTVCSGLGSGVDCALHFGNNFTHNLFANELQTLYPGFFLWDGIGYSSMKRDAEGWWLVLRDRGSPVYFHGRPIKPDGSLGLEHVHVTLVSGPAFGNAVWKVVE